MKKIITAIGNQNLNQSLKKEETFNIMSEDISYQEGIFEILEKNPDIDFIILSELLPGNLEIKKLIEKIKNINYSIEIIIFLEKSNEELENYLLGKGVKFIFYNNQVEIDEIIKLIKNESNNSNIELKKELDELKKILLEKEKKDKSKFLKNKIKEIKKYRDFKIFPYEKFLKKQDNNEAQIICVSGTSGVGKSIFTVNLAKALSLYKSKILIIDFDILNNSLHTILGVKKYSEKVVKKMKNNNLLKELQVEDLIIKITSQINLISGINLMFDSTYRIGSAKLRSIFSKLSGLYDIIIIDTSSECFLDYTREIMLLSNLNIFITEANLLEIKKAKYLLNIYVNRWKIPQSTFKILFNKYNKNAIDMIVLQNIFSNFFILGKIDASPQYNLIINKNITKKLNDNLQEEYEKIYKKVKKGRIKC